jgi:enamine deaminase RidA (YjgF/YER057c/UK114 family)
MSLYTSCDSGRKTPRVGSRGRLHFAFDTENIMAGKIDARLKELDIILPSPPVPVASYVPYVVSGNLVFISGQVTVAPDGLKYVGIVGKDLSLEDGKAAARLCAINVIAQVKAACGGDLDRVRRCVKVTAFVNAVPGFAQHPEVANGASDLFGEVFGEAGKHARAAVGAGSLPRNVACEVEAIFEIA